MLRSGISRARVGLIYTRASSRAFSSIPARLSDHSDDGHHHEEAPEEHLADNPKYLAVGALLVGALGFLGFDVYYSKIYGDSYFGKLIHPTPDAEIATANVEYQERLDKSAEVYDALYAQPVRSPFRETLSTQPIAAGSPFNRAPGASINLNAIGERRELKRSIFD
ncbi:CYFA0S11e00716g1_1 [Cyberlindnera fabianii]|uniref:CYFA0S11e00716g1_1 n=1 Tax=Cyberlindnera fabianii TaxID=36022 RepID=A0A061B022_CYBFA|nr:hypothetical protein BON22_2839 [Cyberlindnera fabianii]CDR43144.1 CYFA0S11e00716g1_1 [Cyberlindnera fabianii]